MKQLVTALAFCLQLNLLTACTAVPETGDPGFAVMETAVPPPPVPPPTSSRPASRSQETANDVPGPEFMVGNVRWVVRNVAVMAATMAAADFNLDGQPDLVAAGDAGLTILLGDGVGGLIPYSQAAAGSEPNDIAVADLNDDGHLDIVVANHETDYLTLLLGDGQGGFHPAPGSPLRLDVAPHLHTVRAADLDGDGRVELIVDHRRAEALLILRGLGDAAFDLPGTLVGVGGDPYLGLAVGDINRDGRLDLVTPNPAEAGVLLNTASDRLAFVPGAPVPAEAPFAVGLGDFDGDDRLDLLAASDEGSALISLYLGDGQGGFATPAAASFRLAPGGKNLVVGDFNGDGMADAAVASYLFADVLVLLGGSDAFQTGHLPGGRHPWAMAAVDLNGDGQDDLVVADDGSGQVRVYLTIAR